MLIDVAVLLFALIRIILMIRKTHIMAVNVSFIILHVAVLVFMGAVQGFYLYLDFIASPKAHTYFWFGTASNIGYFILNICLLIIMFKTSGSLRVPETEYRPMSIQITEDE